jgi:hypothetical protein
MGIVETSQRSDSIFVLYEIVCWAVSLCIVLEPISGASRGFARPNLYLISNSCIQGFCLDSFRHRIVSLFIGLWDPTSWSIQFWLCLPILDCVLGCAFMDKPSLWVHSCVIGDNQRTSGVEMRGSVCSEPGIINIEISIQSSYHTSQKIKPCPLSSSVKI